MAAAAALVATVLLISGGASDGIVNVLPTFNVGSVVAVDTNAYSATLPGRGDVVAFRLAQYPQNVLIKRVIGVAGDVVEETDGVVSVDGVVLEEPYAIPDHRSGTWTVEPDSVFVMGDSRGNSNDSRLTGEGGMGQVPITDIMGKVMGTVNEAADIPPGPAGVVSVP
jgi:signal peptidase I